MTFVMGCIFLVVGLIFLLRNTWAGYVYGIIILGNGVNLILFSSSTVQERAFPFIGRVSSMVDPLPQALVLTAIVISFATLCLVVAVIKKIKELEDKDE